MSSEDVSEQLGALHLAGSAEPAESASESDSDEDDGDDLARMVKRRTEIYGTIERGIALANSFDRQVKWCAQNDQPAPSRAQLPTVEAPFQQSIGDAYGAMRLFVAGAMSCRSAAPGSTTPAVDYARPRVASCVRAALMTMAGSADALHHIALCACADLPTMQQPLAISTLELNLIIQVCARNTLQSCTCHQGLACGGRDS